MEKYCHACGMPLEKKEDFAGNNEQSDFCVHCADENGNVHTCEEIFEGGVQFFMGAAGADRALAERVTRKNMKKLPYWQGNENAVLQGDEATDVEFAEAMGKTVKNFFMVMKSFKLVVFAPITHADAVREAMGQAGAGKIGNYTHCSFSSRGTGRFLPGEGANPTIGEVGKPEEVEEERIEVLCDEESIDAVISAMKAAHPYEEVAYDVYLLGAR